LLFKSQKTDILKKADIDKSNTLNFEEYLLFIATLNRGNEQYDELLEAFQVF